MLFAPRSTKESDAKLINKAKSISPVVSTKKGNSRGLSERVASAKVEVERYFSKFKDDFIIIRTEEELNTYIQNAIKDGIIAIDTETSGLDTFNDVLAGVCVFSPSQQAGYIPCNHVSYITGDKVPNQLSETIIKKYFTLLEENKVKIIMHNASFDLKVFVNMVGLHLTCYWDTMIAANILNENEPHTLKVLHDKYCGDKTGVYSITNMFDGLVFTYVPIKLGYLYAARDARMTYELYKYQSQFLCENPPKEYEDLKSCYDVFRNIEMPLVPIILDAELRGIALDPNTCDKLKVEYNDKLNKCSEELYSTVEPLKDTVMEFIRTHSHGDVKQRCKLQWPINFDSPAQVSELLFKVLKVESKNGTSTGVDELKELLELKRTGTVAKDIISNLLDYRKIRKLLTTYIEKLPNSVNPKTGKIHCNFNQYGTVTGRMSSSNPNLQNIPAKNKDIRKMFTADQNKEVIVYGNDHFDVVKNDIVSTDKGELLAQDITVGTILRCEEGDVKVTNITNNSQIITLYFSNI